MKTTKVLVKRRHILDALRYNNLEAGGWFHEFETVDDYGDEREFNPNCAACLVGSTVRRAYPQCKLSEGSMKKMDELIGDTLEREANKAGQSIVEESDASILASKGLYLAALSAKFEGLIRDKASMLGESYSNTKLSKRDRAKIHKWVLENIPVEFEVKLRKTDEFCY